MSEKMKEQPSNYEDKAEKVLSETQKKSSEKREASFEKIESKTGSFGRLEIMRGRDPNGQFILTLEGDLKGHKVSLKCDSQRGTILGGKLNDQEHFSGTVDGEDLDMHEARDLWVKYSGMAYENIGNEARPRTMNREPGTRHIVDFLLE